jgi:hypothetical protein
MPAKRPDLVAANLRLPAWRLALCAILIVLPPLASRAAAQNYPWCSNFADGAGTNCGFATADQCRVTIAGSGGYCSHNNLYKPPVGAIPARRRVPGHRARQHS